MYHRKPKTTGERRAEAAERADNGRTTPTKGRRRKPPDPWDLEPVNEKAARQFKLLDKWVAHYVRKGKTRGEVLPLFLAKREFKGMNPAYFHLYWGWAEEDREREKGRRGRK